MFLQREHLNMMNDTHKQGPGFDEMSSFFPCKRDDTIQYTNLGYGVLQK